MAEHRFSKPRVVGSTPILRTNDFLEYDVYSLYVKALLPIAAFKDIKGEGWVRLPRRSTQNGAVMKLVAHDGLKIHWAVMLVRVRLPLAPQYKQQTLLYPLKLIPCRKGSLVTRWFKSTLQYKH